MSFNRRTEATHRELSRSEALDLELLIDVNEWCESHGVAPFFPFPAAMTRELCEAIEAIPFREIGRSSAADRAREVLTRGAAVLERALRETEDSELVRGFATHFSAPLRRGASAPSWLRIALHCSASGDAKPELTLALEGEL
jgi:hypothetical protein